MRTTQAIFEGRVQGVFFRATARDIASQHAISGWVRNEPDGSVRLVAQGQPEEIREFLDALSDAKRQNITNTTITQLETDETLEGFSIRL